MPSDHLDKGISVRGTEIRACDARHHYREKIARVTLDSMVQFVGLLDAEGTVLEINKVALDAVGLTLSDVEGRPFWTTFWWQVSPEINQGIRDAIARAVQGEFVRWDTPLFASPDGSVTIIIDASVMPVKDDQGKVVFLACEGRDITEKKAQEREIAEKNLELQGLLARIRELDEIKTQFFANVSHELRTPLALILGPARRLIDDPGTMSLAERREAGEVVARNARMLLKHVNDLLDMSRIEAKKLTIDLVDTDVAALVRFVTSHFSVLAVERNIRFEVDAEKPCVAAVDPEKLQRVLMNLVGNAFKFTPGGGRIRCRVRSGGNQLAVSVDDSGPGVPAGMRQAIFERFRQVDGGINRKVAGTGLGLAIAKEFVEMHKGTIDVSESDLGGARFTVAIPQARLATAAAPAGTDAFDAGALEGVLEELRFAIPAGARTESRKAPDPSSGTRPRILVVEDNPDMNRFIVQCLDRDYDVVPAFDGREGLQKALEFRPLLVVSDIMMPHVSGVEMVAAMRERAELEAIPIILLSAKADEELMVKLLDDGVRDYVVKPFTERELVVRVRNAVLAEQTRAQMETLRKTAENANRAKDEFLAMLGHELRNPLSPILTALQLMKLRGETAAERERVIIERQVGHLNRLVDDLLDVSRIAQGRVELKRQKLEILDVVTRAIEMSSPLLEQRSHRLHVEVPSGLLVDGDPTRLGQVISNLLTNAAKYTPPDGDIWVQAAQADGQLQVSVRDSGIGIAPEMVPHIFDLFVQERQAVARSQGGLGIGLTIVRSLAELHGGSVSVRSDGVGAGSEFIVRLPAIRAEPASTVQLEPVESDHRPRSVPTARARVLVVDDNEDAARLLGDVLTRKGYHTRVALDAPAALEAAMEIRPDIAILDIGLPVMDGYDLATALRRLPGMADLQLIAVTGYGQEIDRQRTTRAGFRHHLIKPVDISTLERALNSAYGDRGHAP
jgi:PAS domain S-box-containing protein